MYLLLALHLLNAFGTKLGRLLSSLQARIMFFFWYLHTHMCMHTFLSGTSMVKPTGSPKPSLCWCFRGCPGCGRGGLCCFPLPNHHLLPHKCGAHCRFYRPLLIPAAIREDDDGWADESSCWCPCSLELPGASELTTRLWAAGNLEAKADSVGSQTNTLKGRA